MSYVKNLGLNLKSKIQKSLIPSTNSKICVDFKLRTLSRGRGRLLTWRAPAHCATPTHLTKLGNNSIFFFAWIVKSYRRTKF